MTRVMAFIDGENLTIGFENSVRDGTPANTTPAQVGSFSGSFGLAHEPRLFVWHSASFGSIRGSSYRAHYYTTFVGSHDEMDALNERIAAIDAGPVMPVGPGESSVPKLVPRVFKKEAKGTKTKSVDVSICVEALEYAHRDAFDVMYLVTGDVDYLPLIRAVMATGKTVRVAALSVGLSPRLRYSADGFIALDHVYLSPEKRGA